MSLMFDCPAHESQPGGEQVHRHARLAGQGFERGEEIDRDAVRVEFAGALVGLVEVCDDEDDGSLGAPGERRRDKGCRGPVRPSCGDEAMGAGVASRSIPAAGSAPACRPINERRKLADRRVAGDRVDKVEERVCPSLRG